MVHFLRFFYTVFNRNKPMVLSLEELISKLRKGHSHNENFLYLPKDRDILSLNTQVGFGRVDINEDNDDNVYEVYPSIFIENKLQSSIDEVTLHDCIQWADKLSSGADNQAALQVLEYYLEFDTVPTTLTAFKPKA